MLLLSGIIGSGCQNSTDSIDSQLAQIDFKIVTMDVNSTETSDFTVGMEVFFAFKAINNSGETLELKLKSDYLACKVFQNEKTFCL